MNEASLHSALAALNDALDEYGPTHLLGELQTHYPALYNALVNNSIRVKVKEHVRAD